MARRRGGAVGRSLLPFSFSLLETGRIPCGRQDETGSSLNARRRGSQVEFGRWGCVARSRIGRVGTLSCASLQVVTLRRCAQAALCVDWLSVRKRGAQDSLLRRQDRKRTPPLFHWSLSRAAPLEKKSKHCRVVSGCQDVVLVHRLSNQSPLHVLSLQECTGTEAPSMQGARYPY